MALTEAEVSFFETFGYLHLPGYMSEELDWISEEHAKLFVEFDVEPDGERTVDLIPFIAQSDRFIRLLEHPKVLGALTPLVGEDFNYLGSDGHYYASEVDFHPDGDRHSCLFLKFGMYLDSLAQDTGCLRVIPGSHLLGPWRDHVYEWATPQVRRMTSGRDRPPELRTKMPAMALKNEPGDVVLFNHNTFHASFGGNAYRRMFAINVGCRARTEAEIQDLDSFLNFTRQTRQPLYSERMLEQASPEIVRHLEQTIERELAIWGEHRTEVNAARRQKGA
jgi:hypothetical protein